MRARQPKNLLRVLVIEDSEDDLLLMVRHLEQHGFRVEYGCAQSAAEMRAALSRQSWNLILADYTLPQFSGLEALRLLQESGLDIPFILLSGVVGEELAIEAMRAGAHDYIPKTSMARLIPAIERELREAHGRQKQRQIEKSLIETELRMRVLAENAQDIIYRLRLLPSPEFEYVSPAVKRILGYEPEEIYGNYRFFLELVHPEDEPLFHRFKLTSHLFEKPFTFRLLNKQGTPVWLENQLVPVRSGRGRIVALEGVARDITARRKAEQELDRIFNLSVDLLCIAGFDGYFKRLNPAFERTLGYTPEELLTVPILQFIHPDDRQFTRERMSSLQENQQALQLENRFLCKPGSYKWLSWTCTPVVHEQLLYAVARDITERKRAEEALRESEARYRQLVELSPDAIYIEAGDRIVFVNPAAVQLFGAASAADLVGKPVQDLIPPSDRALSRRHRQEWRQSGQMALGVRERMQRLDGTVLHVECSASAFSYNQQSAFQVVLRDLTERLNLEAQLRHAQKMEAVGQLAAGVAHDFNNILTIIQGHLGLLRRKHEKNQELAQGIEKITLAADRAAALTRQLLTFSHKQKVHRRQIQLNQTIATIHTMLQRLLGENITLEFHPEPFLPLIDADSNMLEQIIMNLAVNASDAMPQGGILKISTARVEVTGEHIARTPQAVAGTAVCLAIRDSGCGMDAAVLSRIFEPFFTTKEVGKGTGLGLATVYAIVQQHQGWIEVDSEVNAGTTFRIYFPASTQEAPEAECADTRRLHKLKPGKEVILLVEDEAPLLDLTRQILQEYGYSVLPARNGREAMEVWSRRREEVDLLLTDVVMPEGVSGQDLADRLRKEKETLRVLMTSGYTSTLPATLLNSPWFLHKPYQPEKLLHMVRQCLDSQPPSS